MEPSLYIEYDDALPKEDCVIIHRFINKRYSVAYHQRRYAHVDNTDNLEDYKDYKLAHKIRKITDNVYIYKEYKITINNTFGVVGVTKEY